jgi:hypothetical protein
MNAAMSTHATTCAAGTPHRPPGRSARRSPRSARSCEYLVRLTSARQGWSSPVASLSPTSGERAAVAPAGGRRTRPASALRASPRLRAGRRGPSPGCRGARGWAERAGMAGAGRLPAPPRAAPGTGEPAVGGATRIPRRGARLAPGRAQRDPEYGIGQPAAPPPGRQPRVSERRRESRAGCGSSS